MILYWIRCEEHHDIHSQGYVGISEDFDRRMMDHKRKAPNAYFQNAINKYTCH